MDEIDARLIAALAENARLPVSDLARRLGVARTTVQSRLERLEAQGHIAGYTLRRGPELTPALQATVLISLEPRAGPEVLARLKSMPEVARVHTVSGRVDMIAILCAARTELLDAALDRIGAVRGVNSSESLIHLSTKVDRGA